MPREVTLFAPIPANVDRLVQELAALNIPGVRTYSVIGRPGECAGVYPWAEFKADGITKQPAGEYHHIDVTEAQANQIRDAISAHAPVPPEPPAHVKALRDLRAKVKGGGALTQGERDAMIAAVMELMADNKFM